MQWRDRLVGALREMKAGGSSEPVLHHVSKINGGLADVQEDFPLIKVLSPFFL